jgi:N-acetylmuramoyl-L-alanine amidase
MNSRLIVIDPGHGGSDSGARQNGLTEKLITLDVSQRLRTLLVARGWNVKMTRETDTDVFEPNDSAHDELQARCDIANAAGARLFISVHVNSFTSSELNGTTTYYYKGRDRAPAEAVQRRLIAALGTKDDGVRKADFYVIRHAAMPAMLIETAFMSNPDDASLLRSSSFLQKIASAVADGVGDYAAMPQPPVTSMLEQ